MPSFRFLPGFACRLVQFHLLSVYPGGRGSILGMIGIKFFLCGVLPVSGNPSVHQCYTTWEESWCRHCYIITASLILHPFQHKLESAINIGRSVCKYREEGGGCYCTALKCTLMCPFWAFPQLVCNVFLHIDKGWESGQWSLLPILCGPILELISKGKTESRRKSRNGCESCKNRAFGHLAMYKFSI